MIDRSYPRRRVLAAIAFMPATLKAARAVAAGAVSVLDFGAVPDGTTLNTEAIQAGIEHLAARGGGTLHVPPGVFVSGALFLKPGVHLHLDRGAVIRCSTDMENFPRRRTRIEGHFEPSFTPALINAKQCHGLRITGGGTLDGAGRPIWDLFWKLRNAAPDPSNFPNLGVSRARLALIEDSRDVTVEGVTFKDSQYWNLHLYRCRNARIRNCRFEVPDDYQQAPSTDGIDLDSCQDMLIEGCYFSVTDDCIAAKGSKGPNALEDRDSPPVERIRVRNCHFRRGHQGFTCGSEATIVRDVVIENCRVTGNLNLVMLKLRPDTPQTYEDIVVRNIELDSDDGRILLIEPWAQYNNPGGAKPQSAVNRITLSNITGRFGSFGHIRPNPDQTEIGSISLRHIHVTLSRKPELVIFGPSAIEMEDVRVNGRKIRQAAFEKSAAVATPGYRLDGK